MSAATIADEAYARLDAGDVDGLLELIGDALVAIPGATRISGDHTGPDFRPAAEAIIEAMRAGRLRRELVCSYEGPDSVIAVFDNFAPSDAESKYHTAEEWVLRDGVLVALMVYVHEYDVFDRTWQ